MCASGSMRRCRRCSRWRRDEAVTRNVAAGIERYSLECTRASYTILLPAIEEHAHRVAVFVGDGEVGLAIGVEVAERHVPRAAAGRVVHLAGEGATTLVEEYAHRKAGAGDREVSLAVAVEVADSHRPRAESRRVVHLGS